jgi:hypothetical protein
MSQLSSAKQAKAQTDPQPDQRVRLDREEIELELVRNEIVHAPAYTCGSSVTNIGSRSSHCGSLLRR